MTTCPLTRSGGAYPVRPALEARLAPGNWGAGGPPGAPALPGPVNRRREDARRFPAVREAGGGSGGAGRAQSLARTIATRSSSIRWTPSSWGGTPMSWPRPSRRGPIRADRGIRHIYVDGGKTIQGFLAEGLIQELIITRISVAAPRAEASDRLAWQRRSRSRSPVRGASWRGQGFATQG